MKWLSNLKVTHKLMLLLAVLLVGFAGTGFTYQWLLSVNEQAQTEFERLNGLSALTLTVSEQVLQARRREKDFLLRNDLKYTEQHEAAMTNAYAAFDGLESLAREEEMLQIIGESRAQAALYQKEFNNTVQTKIDLGLDHNSGQQGAFRKTVHEVEELLNKYSQLPLSHSMLMMRRHEKDFILRELDKYIGKMAKQQERFAGLLRDAKLADSVKSQIRTKMASYHQGFLKLVEQTYARNKSIEIYREAVHALDPKLAALTQVQDQVAAVTRARVEAEQDRITALFTVTLLVTAVLGIAFLVLIVRTLTRAIARLQGTVQEVAAGNYDARVALGTKDELGQLGAAFDGMLEERLATLAQAEKENDQLNDSIIQLLEATSTLSERDLTVHVPVAEDVTGPVADAMNMVAQETARVLKDIRQVAEQVELAANTVKSQGEKVTGVAANERQMVEKTIVRLEAASTTMNQIATLAQACNEIATQASQSTDTALETVNNTVEGMNEIRETISETEKRIKRLGERSQEISGIVDIINKIAERTHVLALHASMQAAAAGEAGRGFAVVADEVQRLAESSRNSMSQIGALVNNIQTETAETMATMNKTIGQVVEGSELAEQAGKQMRETQATTAELVGSVAQIAGQSEEQAKVSKDLRARAAVIQKSTRETADELKEQTVQTDGLVQYASSLLDSVRVFKLSA